MTSCFEHINTIYLHLTRKCNLSCTYCYFDGGIPFNNELSTKDWIQISENIAAFSEKPKKIVFTGGEAPLRNDFFDISSEFYRRFRDFDTVFCLMSNGTLIDRDLAGKISNFFDEVRISIDAPEQINDQLRGKGTFRKAVEALISFRGLGIRSGVSITVTNKNISTLKTFLHFLYQELFITNIHLSPFRLIGRGQGEEGLEFPLLDAEKILDEFWSDLCGSPFSRPSEQPAGSLKECGRCGVGSHLNVQPDGSVYPCHVLSVPEFYMGNIANTPLPVLLSDSPVLNRLRTMNIWDLAREDEAMTEFIKEYICMGEIYKEFTRNPLNIM